MTDFHSLNTPEEGAADWHLPLNENFRTIDKKIEIRDEASARSDYPPKAGAKYFATDTGAQWIGDGDEWHRLASTGESPELNSISHRDPSGQVLKRRCLLAGPPDEGPISIPAPDGYDVYHIRLAFGDEETEISFNDPPGDTVTRRKLVDPDYEYFSTDETGDLINTTTPFEVYVTEPENENDVNSFNRVSVLGPVSTSFDLSNDPINQIYFDSGVEHVEAWGLKSKDN